MRPSSAPAVAHAGLVMLVLYLALCSCSLSSGPRCSASWPVRPRGTVFSLVLLFLHLTLCSFLCLQARDARHHGRAGQEGQLCGMHQAGIAGALHLVMCLSLVGRPMMLGIMAGMNQTDTLALFVDNGGFTGYDTPRACSCWFVGRPVMFGIMAGLCPLVCCEWRHGPDSAENCLAIP